MRTRHLEVVMAFLVVLALVSSRCDAQCVSGTSIAQWQCWEQTIAGSVDFYRSGAGNPYRDLTLRVTFTAGAMSFTQDAFWLSDTTNPRNFKVRAALPPGNWTWQVAGCMGTTGGTSCATGVTWAPSSGTLAVSANTTGPQLYARGFPTQNCNWSKSLPPTLIGCSPFVYGDKVTPFFWVGDTAWSAPAVEIGAQLHGGTQYWSQYLATRTPSGLGPPTNSHFTTILIAPADAFNQSNAPDVFFVQPAPCQPVPGEAATFPNNCSIPQVAYWNAFDNLVSQANQQDLFLLVAGLMHPFDRHPYSTYPSRNSTVRFSRYLAARMAGFAVMFSPGFDLPVSGTAVDGSSLSTVMDASGSAAQAASPRALITNHLNGQATCTDYESFATETPSPLPWMTSYLFQSGHANNQNGVASTICPGYLTTETAVAAAMRRAITMPLTLAAAAPSLPTINGEGPYDNLANDPSAYTQVDMQYRVRQAANLTPLSNAQGFTYGVTQLGTWTTPSSYWGLSSASDMSRFADRFRPYAGLQSHPEWIVNNPAAYDKQQAIASNGGTYAIVYFPPTDPAAPAQRSITLNTSGLPGLGCPGTQSPWTLTWQEPTTNATQNVVPAACAQNGPSQITIITPSCVPTNHECDWVLLMNRTGAPPQFGASLSASLPKKLEVWSDLSVGDGTSAILAQVVGIDGGPPIEISPNGIGFQDGARVVSVPGGYFVVWHAEGLDGSLLGVFGQRLDGDAHPTGPIFRINSMWLYDQRDPAISTDSAGNAVVVWSSYGQDGDLGGIYGQLFDSSGKVVGEEFPINSVTSGHQARPQVAYLSTGGFVAAWTTDAMDSDNGALSLRLFKSNGSPLTGEIRIPGSLSLHPELVALEPEAGGSFSLRWLL